MGQDQAEQTSEPQMKSSRDSVQPGHTLSSCLHTSQYPCKWTSPLVAAVDVGFTNVPNRKNLKLNYWPLLWEFRDSLALNKVNTTIGISGITRKTVKQLPNS